MRYRGRTDGIPQGLAFFGPEGTKRLGTRFFLIDEDPATVGNLRRPVAQPRPHILSQIRAGKCHLIRASGTGTLRVTGRRFMITPGRSP